MFVGKQFDIVLGVDIHIVQPPGPVPPVPIPHPFVGMVYDPMEFVPILGASILANGIPRAQAGTTVQATVPHIPIGGVFVKPPSNDGEIFMGSMTVPAEGEPFPSLGSPVLTCQDAGMVSIPRLNRKSKSKPKSLILPLSVLIPVPKGGTSTVFGMLIPQAQALALKASMKALGKLRGLRKKRKFKAPKNGTGQTYTVYQKKKIDWKYKRKDGMTNLEAAKKGKPPKVVDKHGKEHTVQLHHGNQDARGPLYEVTHSEHHGNDLHPFKPEKHPKYPVDNDKFKVDREAYWKDRASKI